jgi:type IV pilus assembly protein PilO
MPKSPQEKAWLGAAVLVAIVVAAIGYFFFISPERSSTSDVNGQVSAARAQNDTLQARISSLDAQNRKLSTYKAALEAAQLALPATSDLPNFLRSLQSLGDATLANVTALSVGDPTLVGGNPATSSSSSSTSSDNAAATSTGTTAPTPAPVPTGPQIFELPITAQVSGTIKQLTDFLGQLQSVQPRAVLVSSVTLGGSAPVGGPTSSTTTLDLSLQAFVAPGSAAETAQLAQTSSK